MQWRGRRGSSNIEDRRGMGAAGAGGVGVVGMLAILAVGYFFGIDITPLVQGMDQGQPQESRPLTEEDQQWGEFVSVVLADTEEVWAPVLPQQAGVDYVEPKLVLFSGVVQSACGGASSAMGPFYCPGDRKVYLDTAFFREMRTRFNACPADRGSCAFAQAYVIAHEVGHHVQNVLGILPKVNQARQQAGETEGNALSVRTELQADCFAGVWANKTQARFNFIEAGDVEAALQTAEAIGDDMLQKRSQGYVVPDSFTHGSAAQRKRWFTTGLQSGKLTACNTFNARQL
jgi:uncharacterized protein